MPGGISASVENSAVKPLLECGLVRLECLEVLHPRTRDVADLPVLRCTKSGVVFLQTSTHITPAYYAAKQGEDPVAAATRSDAVKDADTIRRAGSFGDLIEGRRWLDAGSGEGRMLRTLASRAADAVGLEPAAWRPGAGDKEQYRVIRSPDDARDGTFDVITLFHVLEHVTEPTAYLRRLARLLSPGGRMVIEVPHGRDALLIRYACKAYRDHTLWSEHLILHTRESLCATLEGANLTIESVGGCQRYPLANHLHWLARGKAGGQQHWADLSNTALDTAYAGGLNATDETDTLIAIVRKD